jgi:hypothetical protein
MECYESRLCKSLCHPKLPISMCADWVLSSNLDLTLMQDLAQVSSIYCCCLAQMSDLPDYQQTSRRDSVRLRRSARSCRADAADPEHLVCTASFF